MNFVPACCIAQIAAAHQHHAKRQAEAEELRLQELAEANTLKAKRRRARLAAAALSTAEGGGGGDGLDATAASLGGTFSSTGGGLLAASEGGEAEGDAAASAAAADSLPLLLPEYGGLPGVLVHDCGATALLLPNANLESGVVLPTAAPAAAGADGNGGGKPAVVMTVPAVLPEAEAAVRAFVGPPHNFQVRARSGDLLKCQGHLRGADDRLNRAAERGPYVPLGYV